MAHLEQVRDLWKHLYWADTRVFNAVYSGAPSTGKAAGEFAHIIGTEETWLARLLHREPRAAVWPELNRAEAEELMESTHSAYRNYLGGLRRKDLSSEVSYTNSAGRPFTGSVADILIHVALHGQYHRGKINLMLRLSGREPAPADYIAFVRGAPAATQDRTSSH